MFGNAPSPPMNCAYGTATVTPPCPTGTRSPPAGVCPAGSAAAENAGVDALSVPPLSVRFVPRDTASGPPAPALLRPSNWPWVSASVGCSPATSCARVTLRAKPAWLAGTSSLSAAATAAGSSSIVGIYG